MNVIIDESNVGKAVRGKFCDFVVAPGRHRIYIQGPRPNNSKSNAMDVDLAPGHSIDLGCKTGIPLYKLAASSIGGSTPQSIFLFQK
jgi:hypothetical protein